MSRIGWGSWRASDDPDAVIAEDEGIAADDPHRLVRCQRSCGAAGRLEHGAVARVEIIGPHGSVGSCGDPHVPT
ncbi:hypothetical protein FFA01_09200 [Frigoribacterium faeni]|uniref:Uncharacterized protein n=1 Tax=Frigoribacterium faeni TaxID=145483 RepID=A0ABQ0UM97_9MICO|nr:hypothetical protein GCM10025699_66590 [Microbacterium flavescens]GEK82611.1 hypothetical protein FFA01_09200 [Frigoribacterium faeni]